MKIISPLRRGCAFIENHNTPQEDEEAEEDKPRIIIEGDVVVEAAAGFFPDTDTPTDPIPHLLFCSVLMDASQAWML